MNPLHFLLTGIAASSSLLMTAADQSQSLDPVVVVSGSRIRNHFADGTVVEAELGTGDALWRDPQTHWIENIGTTTLHFMVVELKGRG